ncbi:PAS domain S-box protein [Methanoregula sp.]|uniref:PAS domain S-box protein n=1 Tax=Methanoregula sp. TaxID=2052170 RepID=UPI002BE2D875|nr:PAS domain S-box protein [Methanoregula sp.]HVP96205.1 PAS domain S-box protein [Methanoregula sp.]
MISLLYVDDEPALLDVCRVFLEREGDITVVTVASAEEGLTRIADTKFDAIISDYQMPDIDGIAFLRTIRSEHPDMPFILFTGRGREEVVIEAINSGADSYVQKGGDPRAQFTELSHLVRQIVRRRKAETELRLMKYSVDHTSEGILWMRINGEITYYNDAICTLLGYTREEFSGLSVTDIRPGLSFFSLSSGWSRLLTQKCAIIEEILIKKDGAVLPVELVLNYNEKGSESQIFAFIRDISERRRSEGELKNAVRQLMLTEDGLHKQFEELKESDHAMREIGQRYQMLSAETEDWIWECTPDGRISSSNPPVQNILGYSHQELNGKSFADIIYPSDRCRAAASELAGIMAKKEEFRSFRLSVLHRDGRNVTLELTGIPVHSRDGLFSGFYGVGREVAGNDCYDDGHRSCKPWYGSLLERAGDAIVVADTQTGTIIDANQKALGMLKRTLPEILTLQESTLYSPEKGGQENLQNRRTNEEDSEIAEDVIVDRDGNPIPVIVSTKVLNMDNRRLRIGIYHDITDLQAIQEALRKKAGELDRFFTHGPDLLCILDTESRILRLNPAGKALLGCDSRSEESGFLYTIIHPDDHAATRSVLRHLRQGGKAATFINRVRYPDGTCRWLEWRAFMSGRKQIYAVARDLTEQRNIEQALTVANRKLSLLTDLTRHDIRNKLTVLTGYLDLFRNCPGEPYLSLYATKISETVAAISAQVEFTQVYQNLGSSAPAWICVDHLFRKVCRQRNVPGGSVFSPPEEWEIFADPLIDRVFHSLVDNAFRHGATLTEIRCSINENSEGLVVIIEDNGIGIAQGDKERIFVKGLGESSGLCHNLCLAREILSITGITICETGRAGKGARFEMHVPKGMYRDVTPEPDPCPGSYNAPDFISLTHHNHTS